MADEELQIDNKSDISNPTTDSNSPKETVAEKTKITDEDLNKNKMTDSNMPQITKEKTIVEAADFKDDAYSEPLPDPYGRAIKYLEKHNIMQLFQSLTSSIVYNKPEDPISYLMTEVARIKEERDSQKEDDKEIKQLDPN